MKLDARFRWKIRIREFHIEEHKQLVSETAFMGKDILHENRLSDDLNLDAEFFLKFANDSSLCRLTKLDRAAQGANPFHSSSIIQNLSCKKLSLSPMKTKSFETN